MESKTYTSIRLLDINLVSELTSLGKSTIRLWESLGKFPKSIKLSQTKRVWLESDLNDWINKFSPAHFEGDSNE